MAPTMHVTAKICGVSTAPVVDAAIGGGASHLGFVFFSASPRNVSFDTAAQLAARTPPHVGRVGVMVDPDDAQIERAVAAGSLDIIQLHRCGAARVAAVAARTGLPVWAAIAVKQRRDIDAARAFRGAAQRIVYDAKTPDDAVLPGGMGLRFDWKLLDGIDHPLPWTLSGGLDPANVADAVRQTDARLVDVSSGVETGPGIKDVDKVAMFLKAVASL